MSGKPGERYLKKISAKRLCVNSADKNAHSNWSTYGLGLQDSDGAVKADFVDLTATAGQVDFAVDYSLHRVANKELLQELPTPPDAEITVQTRTCLELFGCCREHDHLTLVQSLAKSFANMVTTKKLPAGTLVRLTPNLEHGHASKPVPELYFVLGLLCKKPLQHVLAKTWMCVTTGLPPGSTVFSMVDANSGVPVFSTSHQVFFDLAECYHGHLKSITVSIFQSSFDCSVWGLHQLRIVTEGSPLDFVINVKAGAESSSKQKKQSYIGMPFGLTLERRKRKARKSIAKRKRKQPAGRPMSAQPANAVLSSSSGSDARSVSVCLDSESDCEGFEGFAETSPTGCDSGGCAESNDVYDDDNDADEHPNVDADASAEPVPPTTAAEIETQAVQDAFDDFKADCNRRAELAEVASASMGTFFHSSVGFNGAAFAQSSRSVCYHCEQRIEKGSIRLMYCWSTKKPSRWMHDSCVAAFVQAADSAARKSQAINALRHIMDTSNEELIKNAADGILDKLALVDC